MKLPRRLGFPSDPETLPDLVRAESQENTWTPRHWSTAYTDSMNAETRRTARILFLSPASRKIPDAITTADRAVREAKRNGAFTERNSTWLAVV